MGAAANPIISIYDNYVNVTFPEVLTTMCDLGSAGVTNRHLQKCRQHGHRLLEH